MHRQQEMSQVTEDDVNEVKGDISTLRFELLDVFKNNGMDISSANKNSKGFFTNNNHIRCFIFTNLACTGYLWLIKSDYYCFV